MFGRHLRRSLVATAILTVVVATLAALPGTANATTPSHCAQAIYPPPAGCVNRDGTAGLLAEGWVHLNLNHCPTGRVCAAIYRHSMPAWRWTGRAWVQSSLQQGWVYVSPYTGQWRWAWTQRTGWVAVTGGRFEFR